MQRSKLELYEEVLFALINKRLTVDAIAYECNMDCVTLRRRLDFLFKNNLVEEKIHSKKTFYELTSRGVAVTKTLLITKKLEKLQASIKVVAEALHALPAIVEQSKEQPKSK